MLKTRIATALVLIPLVLAAMFLLSSRAWGIAALGVIAVGAHEWGRLGKFRPASLWLLVGFTVASGLAFLLADFNGWPSQLFLLVSFVTLLFWLLIAPLWLARGWQLRSQLGFGLLGWLLLIATWLALVQLQARSALLLLALMGVVWVADTAAYFVGRRFGKHKLAPTISPGKTWEGAVGGLVAVALYALALVPYVTRLSGDIAMSTPIVLSWIMLAMLMAVLSIVGDLFESQLKRQRGVKDSGRILPGHGGILDRIDALIAALPAAAIGARFF